MRKSFLSLGIIGVYLFFNVGCAQKELLYYSAPSSFPASERTMKSPGFWISRHPSPDKIILKPDEITQLNRSIQNELKLTQDIVSLGSAYSGEKLKSELQETLESFLKRRLYFDDGRRAPRFLHSARMQRGALRPSSKYNRLFKKLSSVSCNSDFNFSPEYAEPNKTISWVSLSSF